MMSDDSENDGVYVENYENDIYYKKYKFLLERCEAIQKHNERLVFRIQEVKKITKRRYEQVQYLKSKLLTEYGEDWKVIPKFPTFEEDIEDEKPDIQQNLVKIKDEKIEQATYSAADVKPTHFTETEEKPKIKKAKRKAPRTEKDPNAPKRPSNPFFLFCQEQRQILMEQINSELKPGEVEPSKQELTKQLAIKWKSLNASDKQVYVDMYERSKEKYAAEMSEYNMKK
ncbi:hypothetical protein AMK59_4753 [Oryctes borbonicus]|uniref:HMG box domain-containing protein n=1 Tax=Oryctes borbonicus TaxID=1629725 RepID=A0A0T6B501_9SCAR|nr:hypothetical protein AMK59_4753 [Oryctes borbonicus]